MSLDFLYAWMAIFLRSLGLILQLPVIAGRPIPVTMRLGLSVCLATLLVGIVPSAPVQLELGPLIAAVAMEVVLGLALGFVMRLTFNAVEIAGRMISQELGLHASPGLGVPEPSHEPVAAMLSSFAIVMFFLLGGHHAVLSTFARSFQLAPAGLAGFDSGAADSLIRATAHVIELGLRIAAPFIAMNFLVTLAFSVLGRAVPKMHVFILSFSAKVLAGFGLLSIAGGLIARYLYVEFGDLPLRLLQVLPTK